ncbi:MAG: hypothetical protein ACLTGJ_09445 [Faecalibacterium prausnitzii]
MVYEYAPAADPNPEQQATKPALSTSEEPDGNGPGGHSGQRPCG